MELLIVAVIGGVVLGLGLFAVIFKVVGAAVDNLVNWAILHFGNPEAARRVQENLGRHETDR